MGWVISLVEWLMDFGNLMHVKTKGWKIGIMEKFCEHNSTIQHFYISHALLIICSVGSKRHILEKSKF